MKQILFEKIEQIVWVLKRIWVFDYIDRLGTYMFLWVWVWFSKHESKFPQKSLCSKLGWVCVFCWHLKMMKYTMHEEENPSFLSSISWQPTLFTHISYWLWVVTCQQHSQSFSKCKTQQSQEHYFWGKSKEIVSISGKHPQSRNFIIFPHLRNFRSKVFVCTQHSSFFWCSWRKWTFLMIFIHWIGKKD